MHNELTVFGAGSAVNCVWQKEDDEKDGPRAGVEASNNRNKQEDFTSKDKKEIDSDSDTKLNSLRAVWAAKTQISECSPEQARKSQNWFAAIRTDSQLSHLTSKPT